MESLPEEILLLKVLERYGKISEDEIDNLSYILKSAGYIDRFDFKAEFFSLYSWRVKATIEQMINEGMIDTSHDCFRIFSLSRLGKETLKKNGYPLDEIQKIVDTIKESQLSLLRFAFYCRILEKTPSERIPRLLNEFEMDKKEIEQFERVRKRLNILSPFTVPA